MSGRSPSFVGTAHCTADYTASSGWVTSVVHRTTQVKTTDQREELRTRLGRQMPVPIRNG